MSGSRYDWLKRASAILPFIFALLLWQGLVSLQVVDPLFLPSPVRVGRSLFELVTADGFLLELATTSLRALGGLVLGAAIGVPLGTAMAVSPSVEGFANPLVKATYSLPKTALVPLFILWFGIGNVTNILAVALATMLPMIVYTYHAVEGAPKVLLWSARAMGTSEAGLLPHVLLRSALPGILTGLRIGLGFAFLIAIAAEMIAAKIGVGKLLFLYGENGAYDFMFAAIAAVVFVSYAADRGFSALSDHLLRWQEPAEGKA
ncbi:ABC transporter permease [Bosea sp. (in: a-proteobacteria)]|jgi:NitT/TauT family transport system permease protein|uniref:ABC transporter permease n=1 Tax=Bosea sp. (in: a-proteobacteria) TaxID=1871050 RepID=UPI002DDD1D9D|nr:ABC transporter permease [Bosea sp. (in: a-proteobacteria)]HEV2508423.1 ABC transporter permease [Bosea sp. (in: a-proteobacteria)]